MRRIVLLGIGHTNADFVCRWARDPLPDVELVCVSVFDRSTYSGMLPGTLGGQYEKSQMEVPLRDLVSRAKGKLILDEVTGLTLDGCQSKIELEGGDALPFDVLSVGVGSVPSGLDCYQHEPGFVAVKPMQTFLERLNTAVRQRCVSGVHQLAIVGGGVASIEVALCADQWTRRDNGSSTTDGLPDVETTIYTAADRLAGDLSNKSVATLKSLLEKRRINVRYGRRVRSIDRDVLATDTGEQHQAHTVVWATGASPPGVIEKLKLSTDEQGFIATKPTLQSTEHANVFAVGDCGTIVANPAPKAGVYAMRQSPFLWHNVRATLTGEKLKSYKPQDGFLKLLNTGDNKALLEYGSVTMHNRASLWLKDWIDRRFVGQFQ